MQTVSPMRILLRKLALHAMLLLSAGSLAAQCPPQGGGQNEIGARLAAVTNQSNIAGRYDGGRALGLGYLNGLHYKRYGDVAAFRTSISVDHIDYEAETLPGGTYTDASATAVHFKMGAEYFAIMGMVEPYVAADLHIARGVYEANILQANGSSLELNYVDRRGRTAYGISPAAGLRVFAGYGISFSAETSFDLMAYNTRLETMPSDPEDSKPAVRTSGFIAQWQPMSCLSVNVLF